jgi:phosphoglycerate dehydrogenase-like enzyme
MATSAGLDQLFLFPMVPPEVARVHNSGAHAEKASESGLMAVLDARQLHPRSRHSPARRTVGPAVRAFHRRAYRRDLGLGDLGGTIATRCASLGMTVIGCSARSAPHPACAHVFAQAELDTVLPRADVLVLAMPLTSGTRDMITRGLLSLLPLHAGVVNLARGGVIDQEALCDMLEAGRLAGAVLDVFDPEPIPTGHRLWRTPNLIISPHVSSDDPDTYNPRTLDIFFRNLAAWRAGEAMPNEVIRTRGY